MKNQMDKVLEKLGRKPSTVVGNNLKRYRQLVDLMLREVVKGSPLLDHTDKTYAALQVSRLAYGALVAETDPMGWERNDEVPK